MSTIKTSQKITPFLWFEKDAEQAINHYVSIFPNSEILSIKKWPAGGPFPEGGLQAGSFVLNGLRFYAFDAGKHHDFNDAVSFFVSCKDQKEVDYYWSRLTEGGKEVQCGWLVDKYGVSWQIVPEFLMNKMTDGESHKVEQMMQAMMPMKKLDVAKLEAAYNQ